LVVVVQLTLLVVIQFLILLHQMAVAKAEVVQTAVALEVLVVAVLVIQTAQPQQALGHLAQYKAKMVVLALVHQVTDVAAVAVAQMILVEMVIKVLLVVVMVVMV